MGATTTSRDLSDGTDAPDHEEENAPTEPVVLQVSRDGMPSFETLPLHDAPLRGFNILWKDQRVVAELSAFFAEGEKATRCELHWEGCTKILIPHESPWGNSVFINRHGQDGERYWVEMQSGDIIEIWASGFSLLRLG